jgi:ribosomal protein S6--L-glutamate ligase
MENRVLNFLSFLNEAKVREKKPNIVMLIGGGTNEFSRSFEAECKRRRIKVNVLDIDFTELEKTKEGHLIRDEKQSVDINPDSTIIIARSGVLKSTHNKEVLSTLENERYFVVNRLLPMEVCENKFVTCDILEREGVLVPKYSLLTSEDQLEDAVKKVGGKFPIVMKLLTGSKGIGVSIVDSFNSLKSVYQTIKKLDENGEVMIQEKIESKYDLRVHVLIKNTAIKDLNKMEYHPDNFKIIGAMRRNSVGKDFRTNYSLGGTVEKVKLTKELEEVAFRAASASGCNWSGVDIMIDEKTKKPYVLEVNSSPGTEGISKALGTPIVNYVIDFVMDRENWILPKISIGYLETLEIEGLGKVVGKFDTGNGTLCCCLHGDKIERKGNTLHFEIGRKKFSKKIIGETDISGGIHTKGTEKYPTVEMGIKFLDMEIDAEVAILDRSHKSTPFLVNRKTMIQMNVSVNPDAKFIVTETPVEDFNQYKAKGKPHSGIKFE